MSAEEAARAAAPHLREATHNLGVLYLQLYANPPVLGKGKMVVLHVWLKRLAPSNDIGHTLPHQQRHAVHGFAWAEDPEHLNSSSDGGNWRMAFDDLSVWQPQLRLLTSMGEVVAAESALDQLPDAPHINAPVRPYHFSFPLNQTLPGRCFKVYEASFPGQLVGLCLPPPAPRLCTRLARTPTHSPSAPALWSLVFPVRRVMGVNDSNWEQHARQALNRISSHASYIVGMGGGGIVLYIDRMLRTILERHPRLALLAAEGRLVLVPWELPERRDLHATYDLALVAAHALLGLSACGANLALLVSDLDELPYSPHGRPWRDVFTCMAADAARQAAASSAPGPGLFQLRRVDVLSSRLAPAEEAAWWSRPGPALQLASGGAAAAINAAAARRQRAAALLRHPILAYDRLKRWPHSPGLEKILAIPARRVVGMYVHDGFPLYGSVHVANASCAFMLHLPNYWGVRHAGGAAALEAEFTPFRLVVPGSQRERKRGTRVGSAAGRVAAGGNGTGQ
ncbi:hypothetical protein GPECTOR_78g72 [Gonium pectorale]|uniref:Glycosyltransferase family 92 protein n=1 Tax=Gonium pectorale TaxID=33097 RepID=A0A150G241_GONPE|nr:hypothetical protein GPECTOR_78g72 [Gonium pectorale]|eukprot:KXZ43884.1 hypothetical protein GPECTOR_78g72 [Gonium pectorale]